MTRASAIRLACVVGIWLGAGGASAQTGGPGSGTSTTPTSTTSGSGSTSASTGGSGSTGGSASTSASTGGSATTTTTASATPSTTASGSATTTTTASASTARSTGSTTGTGTGTTPPAHHDDGDGRDVDFLWIEAMGGISNVNLVAFGGGGAFSGSSTDPSVMSVFDEVQGTGPMVGGALGFRVYWIAVGARATFASYNAFQIGTVGGEVALRLPIPVVEPYARVGFGYAWQGDANYTVTTGGVTTQPATTVYGWAFNAALGVDIFLVNWFTIGAGIGFDLLNMTRQSDPRMACMGVTDFCPSKPGDAVGYQLSGFGQIGFHF